VEDCAASKVAGRKTASRQLRRCTVRVRGRDPKCAEGHWDVKLCALCPKFKPTIYFTVMERYCLNREWICLYIPLTGV
jgi:hypothetical protein